ncbi:MAG: FAD-binding oxidoreductase [Gemmatimonadetes bacterium]|nr:FAD-binding oxidoreductase [Gemmatimonadota bacterium]
MPAPLAATTTDADVRRAFARDASGLELIPDAVARPRSIEEVAELLREATATRTPVTPAGGQSSTTAASITDKGLLLSLRALDHIGAVDTSARTVRVGAGAIVADVRRAAEAHGLLFTPDPTSEEESTVGGAIACNASGARSLRYGATGPHVRALTVLLASGERVELRRPALEKNTVGYPITHDPVEWFVGSEGTLGVVVEAEFALHPLPSQVLGLAIPFAREADALAFVVSARRSTVLHPRCLEFFDAGAMDIARDQGGSAPWPAEATAMVYTEETGADEAGEDALPLDEWLALAESHHALADDIRVYQTAAELHDARRMRHAVPATMNEQGAARRPFGGRKVSTDWAVPYARLADALAIARRHADAAGVPRGIAYGHAGNGHPHQNIIAQDADQLARIEQVVQATLREVIAMGGTVAAEHGIGKIKRKWLPLQASPLQQRVMRALKHELDPLGLLAPGNVLDNVLASAGGAT